MPVNSPTGFLDITNATLRTSNLEAQNLLITGGNIYVTSELEADATVLNLENVTRKGNVSSNTIEITNATTGIVATGNVHALKFIGSGSHLTGIPPTAITGTLSQWSDGANSDVYIASNVGIGNVHTLTSNNLQVGGNLYVRDTDANVLTVNGNVVASYFEGDGSKLSGIVTDLQGVTDNGNVTTNVVQFSNATTGLVTTANIEVGGDIKVVGLSAGTVPYVASDKFLKDSFITMTGDATVITSNLDVTGNIFMRGNKFIVESETKLINDAIIGIANNNASSTTDKGIIMQNDPSNANGNVAIIHHGAGGGFADQLTFGYTADPLDTVTVTNDLTKELTVNVLGNVITQNNLSVGGTLSINNITAAAQHSLQAVTNVGNVTSNTVQFSNAITSLVASSNIVATGNVSAGHDTDTTSYFGRAAVGYMGTGDQASFAHFDRNSSAQYALKQTAVGATTINTPATQHIRFTVNDGNAGAEKMRITSAGNVGIGVSAPHANLHVEGNVYVSSNLTVSGFVGTSGTGALTLPSGTTAQQPSTGVSGMIRFNTELSDLEYYTSPESSSPGVTGGTITPITGGETPTDTQVRYKIHEFTSGGVNLIITTGPVLIEYLIIGGGGGGGVNHGGGGAGGGYVTGTMKLLAGTYPIVIGAGGNGGGHGSSTYTNPTNGGNSSAFGLTAYGGGCGGSRDSVYSGPTTLGNHGASGGGGAGTGYAYTDSTTKGGMNKIYPNEWKPILNDHSIQGHVGGYGTSTTSAVNAGNGGGGGGAGGGGQNATGLEYTGKGGDGGVGKFSGITCNWVERAGGGGGGRWNTGTGSSASGGGGAGGNNNSAAGAAGQNGTGGGGGGGGGANANGGNGGSGVVIVRYKV